MYTKHTWNSDKHFNFKYVQYLPKDYDPNEKYPLVFFLHGAGERGEDLDVAVHFRSSTVSRQQILGVLYRISNCFSGRKNRGIANRYQPGLSHRS